jgi:hypothetical protein
MSYGSGTIKGDVVTLDARWAVVGRAAWQLALEAARALTTRGMVEFSRASLLDEVRRLDPARRPESVGPIIQGMIVNAPGGVASSCGSPLRRVGHGVYRLVESAPPYPAETVRRAMDVNPVAAGAGVGQVDIVLVGCARTKVDKPSPARLLYRSALFDKRRSYAQVHARVWYVLSAEHGLVHPDALLEPYDVALADAPEEYRRAWGQWVVAKLRRVEGDLRGRRIEIHAGHAYAAPLLPLLGAAGADVVHPFAGLRRGEQLAWYNSPPDPPPPGPQPAQAFELVPEPAAGSEPAESWLSDVTVIDGPRPGPGFTYRWPQESESFESSTELTLAVAGASHRLRVAVCDREAYGRLRRRIVVFTGSQPLAEAVGVDDYQHSRMLLGAAQGRRRADDPSR